MGKGLTGEAQGNVILLVPPNKKDYIRDTYYGCWHERKFIDYFWPPLVMYQLAAIIPNSLVKDYSITKNNIKSAITELMKLKPSFIILNIGSGTLKEDLMFATLIKKYLKSNIIVFGQHATIAPNELVKHKSIDIVIKGEPELIINQVIESFNDKKKLKTIEGVCFKGFVSKKKAQVKNLDEMPFPKRDLNKAKKYNNPFGIKSPFTTLSISRGCPYDCIFCTVPILYDRKIRRRSLSNIMSELKLLKNQGFKELFFRDENLCFDKNYMQKLCKEMIRLKFGFKWMCNCRVDTVDYPTLRLMKKAGCHLIKFGVESGSQEILNKIKKGITLQQVENAFQNCKKARIDTVAHFMIGNLGDTKESIEKTIEYAIKLNPTYASFDKVIVYQGTSLKKGKYKPVSQKLLDYYHDLAFKRFYLRPRKVFQHIFHIKSFKQLKDKSRSTLKLWGKLY